MNSWIDWDAVPATIFWAPLRASMPVAFYGYYLVGDRFNEISGRRWRRINGTEAQKDDEEVEPLCLIGKRFSRRQVHRC